jgi:hypothetical protein
MLKQPFIRLLDMGSVDPVKTVPDLKLNGEEISSPSSRKVLKKDEVSGSASRAGNTSEVPNTGEDVENFGLSIYQSLICIF